MIWSIITYFANLLKQFLNTILVLFLGFIQSDNPKCNHPYLIKLKTYIRNFFHAKTKPHLSWLFALCAWDFRWRTRLINLKTLKTSLFLRAEIHLYYYTAVHKEMLSRFLRISAWKNDFTSYFRAFKNQACLAYLFPQKNHKMQIP